MVKSVQIRTDRLGKLVTVVYRYSGTHPCAPSESESRGRRAGRCSPRPRPSARPTLNADWESHNTCVLCPSYTQYFIAVHEVLKVQFESKRKIVDQKRLTLGLAKVAFNFCVGCREARRACIRRYME